MSPSEVDYYRARAADERKRAATATAVAADIHLTLACLYENLVELEETHGPMLHVVGE